MKYLQFTLTMPNRGSWNGRWSGENDLYAKVVKFSDRNKANAAKVKALLSQPNHYYRWSDGWGANVNIKEINAVEARQVKKKSQGFCGYDWMINSIIQKGFITAD